MLTTVTTESVLSTGQWCLRERRRNRMKQNKEEKQGRRRLLYGYALRSGLLQHAHRMVPGGFTALCWGNPDHSHGTRSVPASPHILLLLYCYRLPLGASGGGRM